MQQIKPGTKVRVRSHPEVVGTYVAYDQFYHLVKFPWTEVSSFIADSNLEVVPPKPFDTHDLQSDDLVATSILTVVKNLPGWHGNSERIKAVWRHKPNTDGSRGDYEIIFDAENGGAK